MLSMDKEQCFKAKVATWGLKWKKKKRQCNIVNKSRGPGIDD